jgi:hypothetical protein
MGVKKAHPRKKGVSGTMMLDFSSYDLEELYEIQSELNKEIQSQEDKLRDRQYEQEDYKLEEALEEWRDTNI